MQTFHTFKTIHGFQHYLRTRHGACEIAGKYGGCIDYVKVGGIVYQMEEYDMGGQYLEFVNLKHQKRIQVETADRYKLGYEDAKAWEFPLTHWRNDISYHPAVV